MHDAVPEPPPGAVRRRLADGRHDLLVREEPLLLVVHGERLLTMRTPGRDDDLAVGFLLGEGVVAGAADVLELAARPGDAEGGTTDELHVTLRRPPDALGRSRLARTHEIRSSCGVCGLADAEALLERLPPLLPGVPTLRAGRIAELIAALHQRQELFALTGGSHGALVARADGEVLGCGEDVGRHNALDKLIGAIATRGCGFDDGFVLMTSRASYEIVQKAATVGIAAIAALSAPTGMAVRLAEAAGVTLVGFARGHRHSVYTHPQRMH